MRIAASVLACSLAAAAKAQDAAPAGDNPAAAMMPQNVAGIGLAFGKFGGDFYVQTTPTLDLNLGLVGLGLRAPVNLLVYDSADPGQRAQKTYFSVVRKSDWDELSDVGRIIRYVRIGQKRESLYLLAGELWGAQLGHGTLVNRFTNMGIPVGPGLDKAAAVVNLADSLQAEHPTLGVAFDVNSAYGGAETLVDNIFGFNIVGARAYVRPLSFGDPESFLAQRLAFGATFVADRTAPRTLAPQLDETGSLEADTVRTQSAFGLDVEFVVLESSIVDIIPYVDGNRLLGGGNGLHAGTLFTFTFPIAVKLDVTARLEYRRLQPGYLPVYFDNFYAGQRFLYEFQAKTGESKMPKAAALRVLADERGPLNGLYGEATVDVLGWIQAGLIFEDYQGGPNASLGSFIVLPELSGVKLSVSYFRKDFEGLKNAIKLDEHSTLFANARIALWGPLAANVGFQRRWKTEAGPPVHIRATNDFSFGAEMSFAF